MNGSLSYATICSNMKSYATLASYIIWKEIIASCLELAIISTTGLHSQFSEKFFNF